MAGASDELAAATGNGERPAAPAPATDDIVRLFAEILNKEPVHEDDDFFELGGDSLGAVNVMAFIESHFGVSLPVSAILEASTPRLLAKLASDAQDKSSASCVIRVQDAGLGLPLFVVHGLLGDVGYARRICASLGPTRPIYGLRAVGLSARETPISTIPEIASHYVSELRGVQPEGPYLLHGYCGGGFIAYEMAQQLRRAGEEIPGLVVVDPPLDWRRTPFLVTSGFTLDILQAAAGIRFQWARLRSFFRDTKSDTYRRVLVVRSLWQALARYVPEPFFGDALMIYCGEQRGIVLNSSLRRLVPRARFIECGETHESLFANGAMTLAETKDFIEAMDPVRTSDRLVASRSV